MPRHTFRHDLYRDKVAWIVGGTSGIGAAIAAAFAEHGANVTVTGATEDETAVASRRPELGHCRLAVLDVRSDAGVTALCGSLSRLDIVVNCAGVIRRGAEHDPGVFADVVDINLTGTMRVCTAARALLAESSGCVVNTASMLSFFGGGLVPGYSASKGGVAQLTKSLAIAYAPDRVRVNAIAPGWIVTALTRPLQEDATRSAAILSRTPLARWGEPQDVAGAVLFLCSPAACFITGAVLPVDGGYLIS